MRRTAVSVKTVEMKSEIMEEIKGIVELKFENKDSKSEGFSAYLTTSDEAQPRRLHLYRAGVDSVNDVFFSDLNGKKVVLKGEVEMQKWFRVSDSVELITPTPAEDEQVK